MLCDVITLFADIAQKDVFCFCFFLFRMCVKVNTKYGSLFPLNK